MLLSSGLLGAIAPFGETFVNGLLNTLRSELFIIFLILSLGYLFGRINIRGVSFGSSGVFIVALLVGVFLSLNGGKLGVAWSLEAGGGKVIKTVKDVGLAFFVTSIGLIAGPTFIRNFKKKAASYVVIGITAVLIGTTLAVLIALLDGGMSGATVSGLMMGALTSTPGFTAAQEVFAANRADVAAAVGLTYPFGVLGKVLFVQLLPKILGKDMAAEREKMRASLAAEATAAPAQASVQMPEKKRFQLDKFGICSFAITVVAGMLLGALTFRFTDSVKFSLGVTGGTLIVGLLLGHFGHVGRISLEVPKQTLNLIRELGLVMFLAASGIEGGLKLLEVFHVSMLLYGAVLTLVPLICAFLIARFVFKLDLLNNLGAICGATTSTPALGALIHVAETDEVAQFYAATYPIALFLLVFAPQIINLVIG